MKPDYLIVTYPESPNWFSMRQAAVRLWRQGREGKNELIRHARVSLDNRHECRQCFTCACAHVWKNRGEM
jgi:hypothetical protein